MRFCNLVGFAAITLALSGCFDYDHYEVKLKPDGKALDRELTYRRERAQNGNVSVIPASTAVLAAIEKAYDHAPADVQPQSHRFNGRFTDQMPQDIGGSGTHFVIESPLGEICAYMERFRGNDDLVGQLEVMKKAANQATDLLMGWFESQMRDDMSWPNVRKFLDGEFRKDLHNLLLYIWLGRANASADDRSEEKPLRIEFPEEYWPTAARLAQYLIEHGYFDPKEAMDFLKESVEAVQRLKAAQEIDEVQARCLHRYWQMILAKKSGLNSEQIATSLAFLLDVKAVEESFGQFMKNSPEYGELKQIAKTNHEASPEPDDLIGEILFRSLIRASLEHADTLDLGLATSDEPLATNGTWNETAKHVVWRRSINAGNGLPTLCYAAWCEPNVVAQEKHFGRVVLRGDQLAEYVALYSMLDSKSQSELDQFVQSLDPADDKSKVYAYAYKLRKGNPLLRQLGSILASAIEKHQPAEAQ